MKVSDQGLPQIAALSPGRAAVYRALAGLYLEPPSPDFVAGLLRLASGPGMARLFAGPGVECLRRFAGEFRGDASALRQEFHDLFIVPLGRYVTPYEAVYRDERVVGDRRVRGLLMGPSTLRVREEYRQAGWDPTGLGELPDHVGVELAFMAFLCARERGAWERGEGERAWEVLAQEQRFLGGHLLAWVPALAARIAGNAASDFYRGIGFLTEQFVCSDAATVRGAFEEAQSAPGPAAG